MHNSSPWRHRPRSSEPRGGAAHKLVDSRMSMLSSVGTPSFYLLALSFLKYSKYKGVKGSTVKSNHTHTLPLLTCAARSKLGHLAAACNNSKLAVRIAEKKTAVPVRPRTVSVVRLLRSESRRSVGRSVGGCLIREISVRFHKLATGGRAARHPRLYGHVRWDLGKLAIRSVDSGDPLLPFSFHLVKEPVLAFIRCQRSPSSALVHSPCMTRDDSGTKGDPLCDAAGGRPMLAAFFSSNSGQLRIWAIFTGSFSMFPPKETFGGNGFSSFSLNLPSSYDI